MRLTFEVEVHESRPLVLRLLVLMHALQVRAILVLVSEAYETMVKLEASV
jgi:hypothetical protein